MYNWSLEHACDLDASFSFSFAVPWYAGGDMIYGLSLYLKYSTHDFISGSMAVVARYRSRSSLKLPKRREGTKEVM